MTSVPRAITNYLTHFVAALCFIVIALDRTQLITALHGVALGLYQLLVLLAGLGLLLGVINVLVLHLRRILHGQGEWSFSLLLVVGLLATLVAGLLQPAGVTSPTVEWIFDSLIAPGQASLYALLVFFMVAAAYRYLRVNLPGGGWMLTGALLMLIMQMPATYNLFAPTMGASLGSAMGWLLQTGVMATLRGALLGSSLALMVVAVRYLMGRTKP